MIDKNVPIPKPSSKYPFEFMEIGDSILVQKSDGIRVRASAYQYGRRYGKTFVARKVDDGYRIWRTA